MFVKLWMRSKVITLLPDATIAEASSLMNESRIRRIPVTNQNNRLLGIISKDDIKKALPSTVDANQDETSRALANQVKIESFMTQAPITVSPVDTLEKVATIMRQHKVGGIPVVENDLLVGIITESDIFDAFVEVLGGSNKDTRIEFTIPHDTTSIYKVFDILAEYDVQLNNIAICNNHSVKTKMVTLRFESGDTQEVIDELWNVGCKISSIIPDN